MKNTNRLFDFLDRFSWHRLRQRTAATLLTLCLAYCCAWAQPVNLADYLPYSATVTSTFSSSLGINLEITGDSPTHFHWHATHPALEGLRQDFRLDGSGLVVLMESGTAPGSGSPVYTQTYSPTWLISPAAVTMGQVIHSSAGHSGYDNELGAYAGTNSATLTIGTEEESVTTPAGTFDALKATFINSWQEAGTGWTASGITTQNWWMARSIGVVRLDYGYEQSFTPDGEPSEDDAFELSLLLESHSLVKLPELGITLLSPNTARLAWDSIPGWTYQLQSAPDFQSWTNATSQPTNGTGDTVVLNLPINTGAASFRLEINGP